MAPKHSISSFIIMFIIPLSLFSALSHGQTIPSPDIQSLCSSTLYPPVCLSMLTGAVPDPVSGFTGISLQKSLEASNALLALFATSPSSSLSQAIEDCTLLVTQSSEYLSLVEGSTDPDYSVTLLSAVMSSYDTCQESIGEVFAGNPPPTGSLESEVLSSVSSALETLSVCLALFREAYPSSPPAATLTPARLLSEVSVGKMSERERMIFERVSVVGRKLLQSPYYPSNTKGVNVTKTAVVNPNDPTAFPTINAAVAAAPTNAGEGCYYVIYVVAGVYEEYVTIPSSKTYLMLVGDGIGRTIITGNKSFVDNSTTFASATLAISGKGFVAANITVQNTAGAIKHQAVAVRTSADKTAFYRCSFEAYQDTLYVHTLRQFYRECDIYGTVDFIFGNAAVVFQDCNIFPRLPLQGQFNAITAQGRTDPNQNTGISIQNCTIKPSAELVSANFTVQTFLGRPWKEYSRTVYLENFMDSFIDPKGWMEWMGDFALSTLYYAEYENTGPGSNTTNRVKWTGYRAINETDAERFTVDDFIAGHSWLSLPGVPFSGGLVS